MLYCSMFRGNILEWPENRLGARNRCHRSAAWPSVFNLWAAVSSPGNESRKDHLHHLSVRPRAEGWSSPLDTKAQWQRSGDPLPAEGSLGTSLSPRPGPGPLASCSGRDAPGTGSECFITQINRPGTAP